MKRPGRVRVIEGLACAAMAAIVGGSPAAATADDWSSKVDPWVLETARSQSLTEFLVVLEAQADLGSAASKSTRSGKGRVAYDALSEMAAATQPAVLAALDALGAEYRPFWIVNAIWVRGDLGVVQEMARRGDVARVSANPRVRLAVPGSGDGALKGNEGRAVEPNISLVGAPDLWAAGVTGQGVVIAGQDTGYDWDHPALKNGYRGWSGSAASHDYNWHDAIHQGGGVCGWDWQEPCDDSSHGTHTMGTMVGDDGAGNQIGVAPGARWIGCRNMDQGWGTPASYMECFQFFMAPTDLAGLNPDPDLAPHVINNSWVCSFDEGCTDPNTLRDVVENTRAAGILVVASAGNAGDWCETVASPPAIYDASLTVGATDNQDQIAAFSSRGPVTVDGSNRIKPDVVAPGVDIRSSVPGGGYDQWGWSGTSMAGPHVAGVAALAISAAQCPEGPDVSLLEQFIIGSAVPQTTNESCGGVPGSTVPNNTYGHGALRAADPGSSICLQEVLFGDDFESGDTSAWSFSAS